MSCGFAILGGCAGPHGAHLDLGGWCHRCTIARAEKAERERDEYRQAMRETLANPAATEPPSAYDLALFARTHGAPGVGLAFTRGLGGRGAPATRRLDEAAGYRVGAYLRAVCKPAVPESEAD